MRTVTQFAEFTRIMSITNTKLRDFWPPPRCKWALGLSGILWNLNVWDGLTGRPETSVTNYQSTPRNIPEKRRSETRNSHIQLYLTGYNGKHHLPWVPAYLKEVSKILKTRTHTYPVKNNKNKHTHTHWISTTRLSLTWRLNLIPFLINMYGSTYSQTQQNMEINKQSASCHGRFNPGESGLA